MVCITPDRVKERTWGLTQQQSLYWQRRTKQNSCWTRQAPLAGLRAEACKSWQQLCFARKPSLS